MRISTLVRSILAFTIPAIPLAAQTLPSAPPRSAQMQAEYGKLPLTFEANQGQTNPQVKFLSHGNGYNVFLTAGGMVLSLGAKQALPGASAADPVTQNSSQPATKATVQFNLVGAARNPAVIGEDPQPGKANYFIGSDPAKWQTNVSTYGRVRYKNIYPGIDLLYYGNHRQLEYDFAVSPAANPSQIQFEVTGANGIQLDSEGNLVLQTSSGELHLQTPTIYQESAGTRSPVSGAYFMRDSTHIGFSFGQYDSSKPLVIDPVLVYSTYLGGSGDDQASGIVVDSTGNVYLAGFTDSTDFPLATLGTLAPGSTHVFVAKFDPTGSNLIYADYIGGNSDDYGYALVLDSSNEVYVTGSTASSDFPLVNPFQGTYPGSFNAFLSQLSSDGSSLLYSTYLGGNGSDIPSSIAIDASNDVIVAGNTSSTNFPTANAYQPSALANQGGMFGTYGFLTKFSASGSYLIYSTYLAGNSNVPYNCGGTPCWSSPFSAVNGIALDTAGNVYAAGITNTYNFPTTSAAYQAADSTQLNDTVGFVSKFSGSGGLDYSTYFYESSGSLTNVNAIAVDGAGSAYITGVAFSDGTFPITSTSICNPGVYGFGCDFAFVTKFDPAGSTLLYSTFLGPNNSASPRAITLDAENDAYVIASTSSSTFATVNGIESYANGSDFLLVEIDPLAATQLFATYIGGSGYESPSGIAIDANKNLYIAGTTFSTDFPVTPGAFQQSLAGNSDAFALKIAPATAPAVSLNPDFLQYSLQTSGSTSPAQTTLLRNMGSAPLSISSITASGDFAETDNCGAGVTAAGTCTLSITFTPTAAGIRTGYISIQDDAAGSPHLINLSGSGSGAFASLTPASLNFTAQLIGTASGPQSVVLTNTGNLSLSIANFQITGDFSQVNNCQATLAAASSCTVNVTFTPTASGNRTGILTITDNGQGNSQSLNLTGIGSSPTVTVSPTSVSFTAQPMESSSSAQSVTLTNSTTSALSLGSIQISGDFAETNNCPTTLASGSGCTVAVTFTPTATGNRSGTMTISTATINGNGQSTAQVVNLTGAGTDFSLASSPSTNTLGVGATATYSLNVSPTGGNFNNMVKLSCSVDTTMATCSVSPSAVTPNGSPAAAQLIVSNAQGAALVMPNQSSHTWLLALVQFSSVGFMGMIIGGFKRSRTKFEMVAMTLGMIASLIFMAGCGAVPPNAAPTRPGAQRGTYTITVTGSSGNLQHSLPLTLVVQ